MAEIWKWNAPRLSAAYAAHEISPVEVAQSLLARIAALDGKINSFCLRDADATLAMARASQARWLKDTPLSPLDGVPVAVKDLLLTRGWPTLRGSRLVGAQGPWEIDAPVVARLREAGAVLLGKTTTPDHGWKAVTDSPLTGVTRNPWDLGMTPGGSSGGSAAAVAARLAPLALGSDGGGSIRVPASFSGVFGLKPSYGRVPAYPLSPFGTLAHLGPMSRDVEGSAMLLNVMARDDPRDPHALPQPGRSFMAGLDSGVKAKRMAFSPTMGFAKVDGEVAALVAAAARRFSALGAELVEIDPPGGDPAEIFAVLWWGTAAFLFADLPAGKKALLDPGLAKMAEEGMAIDTRRYIAANAARGQYASQMRVFMEDFDFLLTPAVAVPAFEVEKLSPHADSGTSWTPFCLPFNLTQQPAASVPCGFTRAGLPVGLQIAGRHHDDWGVLEAARAYEEADPRYEDMPPGFA